MFNSKWLARLSLAVTVLSTAAGLLQTIKPEWAIIVAGLSGALSAFLTRVQPIPTV